MDESESRAGEATGLKEDLLEGTILELQFHFGEMLNRPRKTDEERQTRTRTDVYNSLV